MSRWGDPFELEVGDLVVYEGSPDHCSLRQRIVYRVFSKDKSDSHGSAEGWTSWWRYGFQVAFDAFPRSEKGEKYDKVAPVATKHGSRGIRKLELLDLATLRNQFDLFIRARAQELGGGSADAAEDR